MRRIPHEWRGHLCLCAAWLLLAFLTGCGGGGGGAASTVTPGPEASIVSFTTLKATLTAGSGTTLTPVFIGATSATIDQGVGEVASGSGVVVTPAATTTYTLTVGGTGGPVSQTVTITVVPPASITSFSAAPAAVLAGGGSQLTAVFSNGAGSVDHGVGPVTSGAAVATGNLAASTTFTLTVTNPAGDSVNTATTVTVGPVVAITAFSAAKTVITAGASTTLTPVFVNATGASIDQGVGAVSSGSGFTVTPAATTMYTLTAAGLGGPAIRTMTVTVVPPASITSFGANPAAVATGTGSQLTAVFSNGAGSVDHGVGPVPSGAAVATGNLAASATFTLTVTNAAGDSVTASATVTVGSAVAITGFSSAREVITAGSSTSLTPLFVNAGGASVDQGVGTVASGGAVTVTPTATTTYTLTVTGLGGPATQTVTVTVVPPASITRFGANPAAVATGTGSQLTAVFSDGVGSVDHAVGPVTSGAAVATGSLGTSTAFLLTVTNPAGDSVTASTTVTVGQAVAITGFSAARYLLTAGASTTLAPSYVNATDASIDQSVGAVASGAAVTVTPAVTTTYTLTAVGLGGPVTQAVTVTVVPAAAITSFSAAPAAVLAGGSSQLTAVFSGGSASIDHGVGSVTSGLATSTGPLLASTTFGLTVTNAAGDSATASATVTVGSAVAITGFSAAKSIITAGTSTTLTPLMVNATGASIDQGAGAASSGTPVTVTPAVTTTYTLTATGPGGPVTQAVTVTVVAPASITSFSAAPATLPDGGTSQLTAVFSGGTASIDHGIGAVTSGAAVSTGTLTVNTSFGLTVTNGAGDSVTATAPITVTYLVTFAAGPGGSLTGTASQIVPAGSSCTPVTADPSGGEGLANWTGTGGFVTSTSNPLTVQNVTANMTITANFGLLPKIYSFSAVTSTINLGYAAYLNYSVLYNYTSASIDNGVGPLPSPNGMAEAYPSTNTTYTLTVSNALATVTASVTITVISKPGISSFTATPATIAAGQSSTLAWTATGTSPGFSLDQSIGTVAGSPIVVSPTVTTTYTLTASNPAGTKTATTTVTVAAGPPAALTYSDNPAIYTRTLAIAANNPTQTGGAVVSYNLSKPLPAGLAMDTGTGVITGTPTVVAATDVYQVTATNAGGSTSANLTLTVNDLPPVLTGASGSYTYSTGTAITPLTPGNTGGAVVSWTIYPSPSPGLLFNTGTGTLSGTPTAAATAQVYTITASNSGGSCSVGPSITVLSPGPVITTQPYGQIITQGSPVTFTVVATGASTLGYQWYRNGSVIPLAVGSSYGLASVVAGDDGAVFTVAVNDSSGNSTPSAPAQLSLFRDLATWLGSNPTIANAIKWQFQYASADVYTPPTDANKVAWPAWSASQQSDLNTAYLNACAWFNLGAPQPVMTPGGPGLTDQPVNYQPGVSDDNGSTMVWVDPTYMWQLYTAHVAFSLMLELSHQVPWSVAGYTSDGLKWLFDSATMAWFLPNGYFSMGTYDEAGLPALRTDTRPRTSFADPRWTYAWLKQAGLLGASRPASIGNTMDWMRDNLWHFFGTVGDNTGEDFGIDDAVWQYRGYAPISQIVNGTIDSRYPGYGVQHWTAGCHGSVAFLNEALRVVNIPVQPIWVCGHELAYFMSEDLYLDHGDDPYNAVVKAVEPPQPTFLLLFGSATYQTRFTSDLTVNILDDSSPALAWVGWAATNFPAE